MVDLTHDDIEVATLDPFHGYKNAIDDPPEDAVAALGTFHVIKLGTDSPPEVRRGTFTWSRNTRATTATPASCVRPTTASPAKEKGRIGVTESLSDLDSGA